MDEDDEEPPFDLFGAVEIDCLPGAHSAEAANCKHDPRLPTLLHQKESEADDNARKSRTEAGGEQQQQQQQQQHDEQEASRWSLEFVFGPRRVQWMAPDSSTIASKLWRSGLLAAWQLHQGSFLDVDLDPSGHPCGRRTIGPARATEREIERPRIDCSGKDVLEVGCGCGLAGVIAGLHGARSVTLTDCDDRALVRLGLHLEQVVRREAMAKEGGLPADGNIDESNITGAREFDAASSRGASRAAAIQMEISLGDRNQEDRSEEKPKETNNAFSHHDMERLFGADYQNSYLFPVVAVKPVRSSIGDAMGSSSREHGSFFGEGSVSFVNDVGGQMKKDESEKNLRAEQNAHSPDRKECLEDIIGAISSRNTSWTQEFPRACQEFRLRHLLWEQDEADNAADISEIAASQGSSERSQTGLSEGAAGRGSVAPPLQEFSTAVSPPKNSRTVRHWSDVYSLPQHRFAQVLSTHEKFDIIIAADCLYFPSQENPLLAVLTRRLRVATGSIALVIVQTRSNGGFQVKRFIASLEDAGLAVKHFDHTGIQHETARDARTPCVVERGNDEHSGEENKNGRRDLGAGHDRRAWSYGDISTRHVRYRSRTGSTNAPSSVRELYATEHTSGHEVAEHMLFVSWADAQLVAV
eukprot:TRINITY_DN12605_c0_g1_i2.p1 TRINITY_DN12605_c0_g1~~TRINITY_DN12605_c0_g1_i2.p1  ORF type:complete len:666 (-),score=91.93 TRINITY_DN12605_c0_g1_i2:295-2214(-)